MLLFLSSELVPHFLSVCRYRKLSLQMGAVYLVVNRVRGGTGCRWLSWCLLPGPPGHSPCSPSWLALVVFGNCLTASLEVRGHPDLQHFLISMQLKLSHRSCSVSLTGRARFPSLPLPISSAVASAFLSPRCRAGGLGKIASATSCSGYLTKWFSSVLLEFSNSSHVLYFFQNCLMFGSTLSGFSVLLNNYIIYYICNFFVISIFQ